MTLRFRRRHWCDRLGLAVVPVLLAFPLSTVAAGGLIGTRAVHATLAPQASVATSNAARFEGNIDTARITFDLSAPVKVTAFALTGPDRVIVDLPQVDFGVDPEVGKLAAGRGKRAKRTGFVNSFRFGLLAPGRSRIVVDLDGPAKIVSASVEKTGDKSTLVVELAKTDRESFRASARNQALAATTAGTTQAVQAAPNDKPTIVIDPGHGGPDNGALVNGVVEKDVTLAFAKMLAAKLQARADVNVVMTRSSDVFIPLSERVHVARTANAALMVSIHADTLPETADVSGATVYTVSDKASDAYAAKVAAKENEADASVGVDGQADTADVNDILFDLTRQETRAYSHVFARTLVNYWKVAGRLNKNPQRSAGFVVLKAPDVPSVLLELGYLSCPQDSASLISDEWRDKATARMVAAIEAYFAERRGLGKGRDGASTPMRQANAELSAPEK